MTQSAPISRRPTRRGPTEAPQRGRSRRPAGEQTAIPGPAQVRPIGSPPDLSPLALPGMQRQLGNGHVARLLAQRVPPRPPMLSSYAKATDIPGYINLVREVEKQYPEKNSLEILAMLRQAYYGKPWSVDTTPQWSDVIPAGGNPGDPRSRIGSGANSLFDALKDSQEVGGTDMGHIFAGLQAMFHPTTDVALTMEILGQSVIVRTVNMPNTEFATWGGDVGAAAGRAILHPMLGGAAKSDADYFDMEAPDQDLEGNLDAYGMVTGGGGATGLQGMLQAPGTAAPGTPVSQVLYEYFLGSARLAGARTSKYKDFATTLGGVVAGKSITNRAALEGPITTRVADFGNMFFWGKYKAAKGTLQTTAVYPVLDPVITPLIQAKARIMVRLFLDWVEKRL